MATKILIIDDEPANVRALTMLLESDGYEVLDAYDGEEGLAVFEANAPQIVLTDIRMPGIDGIEVLRRIKMANADTEVIIITGHGDIDSAVEALQHGASDFINKPVRDEALDVALKRAEEKIAIRARLEAYTNDLETMVTIATEEFQRKSNFQEKLIQSSEDAIIATDENWGVVIYNPGARRIFGYTKAEVSRSDVRQIYPDKVVEIFEAQLQSPAAGRAQPYQEVWIEAKDGQQVPTRFSGTVLWEKGKMVGTVAFFHDMREVKRLERELVNAERLAAIGQTVAGMAHCIKNILHGFKGGSYLMNVGIDKQNDDKIKNGWQMIQRNIQRTSDLVMDLLSYSKDREPEFEPCLPNQIADDVCELLMAVAEENHVRIVKAFSPALGEVVIDPRTAHRCLMNLVSNAIDACLFDEDVTKDHEVRVKTDQSDSGFVVFEVHDNGSGMPPEVKERLFASFFSTKGAKGTGLGLLVTSKLVQEHGGDIDVASQEGRGTTFTVRLKPHQTALAVKVTADP
jgi:PAS domain S-box-containing protein